MLASPKCSLPSNPPHLFFMKRGRKYISKFSKKEDTSENPKSQDSVFPLKVSNVFLARSAIAVLGLGFIDAGYSGDWSRIGAITRETEEMLKVAAYLVAPMCLFLIFSTIDIKEG
ncbi:uncharacterized protein LOC131229341 isoform X1 [Magnolia sinica]|uniref:uncharacterized protein LOC131229341 isoform X1 n=1 Tax=Magnolia sinica TaxID=86752 RepID=UPI00265966A4|nr:uncharacterized protein LOC131229341 isoform X1 [Magnolia sinica]